MIGTKWVKAAPGMKVPREENARRYITEADGAVEVPRSMYYTRCVMFGDLLDADAPDLPSSPPDGAPKPVVAPSQPTMSGAPSAGATPKGGK